MISAAKQLEIQEKRAKREHLELTFKHQLKAVGLHEGWVCQHKFHPKRQWALDFAMVDKKLAIEIEGGTHANGRHNRPKGFEEDCHKYNELSKMGWTLFRFTSHMVKSGNAIMFVEDYINERKLNGASNDITN